jgi:hypothetical protein
VQRKDIVAALAGTFLFGWGAAFVGSRQDVDWLYWMGLGLVGLPLVLLMIWLPRIK